jgi:hypothetical protein
MATVADSSITLDKLPDELILEITGYLTFPSLRHVVFVGKRLHAIALLNFYSWFPGYNPSRFLHSITLPPPAGRPQLAIGVKTVNWHCGPSASAAPARYPWGELDALDLDISASDRWAIARAYQQLVLIAPPRDQASLDSRFASHVNGKLSKHNWALEFLLMFVPNVEELIVLNTNR